MSDLSNTITKFLKSRNKGKKYLSISVKKMDYGYMIIFYYTFNSDEGLYNTIIKQLNITDVTVELCAVFNLKKEELKIHNKVIWSVYDMNFNSKHIY